MPDAIERCCGAGDQGCERNSANGQENEMDELRSASPLDIWLSGERFSRAREREVLKPSYQCARLQLVCTRAAMYCSLSQKLLRAP